MFGRSSIKNKSENTNTKKIFIYKTLIAVLHINILKIPKKMLEVLSLCFDAARCSSHACLTRVQKFEACYELII